MVATSLPVLNQARSTTKIDADRLRRLALDCGADDAGLVEIGHPPERIKTERFGPTGT